MKYIRIVTVAIILAVILTHGVFAGEDALGSAEYSTGDFGVGDILDVLPDEVRSKLPEGNVFEPDGFTQRFSVGYFFSLICSTLTGALPDAMNVLCSTLGVLIISSVLSALKKTLNDDCLTSVFEIVSTLAIMLTLYTSVLSLCSRVSIYLSQLKNIVGAMVPVTIAIGSAGGNVSASAVSGASFMLGITLVEFMATNALYPILKVSLGLSVASGIGKGFEFGALTKLIRGTFMWVLSIVVALISAVMTFQCSIAARADSLSMRALKFAASKAVPVVGGVASDAVSTLAQSLSLIKGTVGWGGIIIIAVLTLPVIVNVILTRLAVLISQTAAEVLGLDREGKVLGEAAGLLGFLGAVCVIAALMFVYALAVFAQSSAALV